MLGSTVLTALLANSTTLAVAPPAGSRPVELIVETENLSPIAAERLRGELEPPITERLRAAGFEVVDADSGTDVIMQVRLRDPETLTYELGYAVREAGAMQTVVDAVACVTCPEQKVVEKALDLLPEVTAHLAIEPEPASERDCESGPGSDQASDRPNFGALSLAGAALSTAGLVGIVGGAALFTVETTPGYEDAVTPAPKPIGAALIGVGVTAAVLGAAALVVDLAVLAPRRRARRTKLSFDVSPRQAGLILTGRF